MKKLIFSIFLSFLVVLPMFAKKQEIDPFYLTTEPLNPDDFKVQEKPKDPRTLGEKVRAKLHLKPSKKIYLHNIDRTSQPITTDDYYIMALDKKRSDFIIPEPEFKTPDELILPDPHYRVVSYNSPPGQRNINLSQLINTRTAVSPGILSPDKSKMVYTSANFYPRTMQTASAAYVIPVLNKNDAYQALYMTNIMSQDMKPIVTSGMEQLIRYQYKTLFPIDFSQDSSKIAFKEKVGSNLADTWQTNVIVYDFDTGKAKRLTAVREAIIYWWRQNRQIELKDYMWDIFPVGWEKQNPDRLVVYAYAFTGSKPLFLGTWSIDYNEEKSALISIDTTDVQIDLNGFGLKKIELEN